MNRILLIFGVVFTTHLFQAQTKPFSIEHYKNEILPENELLVTTNKAIEYIKINDHQSFRSLFIPDALKNVTDEQFINLVNKLNEFLIKNEIPKEEDINATLNFKIVGKDTLAINQILYQFKNNDNDVISFSFLKSYGSNKLVGINLDKNPFKANPNEIQIKPLSTFEFNVEDVENFRIYFSEKKNSKKNFKNTLGVFAIEGNAQKFSDSKLNDKFKKIFNVLRKTKFEKKEIFSNRLSRGKNPEFIQAQLKFKNLNYSIFLYLQIENGEIYDDYILLQQEQLGNLGYRYYIKKSENNELVKIFKSIIGMNLENYFEDNP